MDPLKAAFEAQFGTEWAEPVVPPKEETEEVPQEQEEEFSSFSESEDEGENPNGNEGPITVKHSEPTTSLDSKAERRRFMTSKAPKVPTEGTNQQKAAKTKNDDENIKNDYALQRLINESNILSQQKGFSGAEISGIDPLNHVGGGRLKIMEARLTNAGAKKKKQTVPPLIAKGIRDKAREREQKHKHQAMEAGIILAKEKHQKKAPKRDRGLKINSIGRASPHGVHISPAEIARIQNKSRRR